MNDTSDNTYQTFYNTMQLSDAAHVFNERLAMIDNNITLAQSELALIADTNTINHNRITVDNIYLNTWAQNNYNLTEAQISVLYDIAYSDPFTNGDAVYTARVMLNIDPDDSTYDRKSIQLPKQETKTTNTVRIYPNPAKEEITITFEQAINGEGSIEIWSIMGNKLLSDIIPKAKTEQKVNVKNIPSGIYFYIIKVNGEKLSSGKLTILK